MVEKKAKPALKAGVVTIALATFLVLIKGFAFLVSGSMAVLSSMIDSIMDVSVSLINTGAVYYSAKPADEEHRYGHGKIEGLAALFQASVIFGASVFLALESFSRLFNQEPIEGHGVVVGIMIVSMIVSVIIVTIQNYAIKRSGSLAVESDRAHYSTDIFMNAGVIAAILIQFFNGPLWVDAGFALLVVFFMGRTAYGIARKGMDMILDRELPEEQRAQILNIIEAHDMVLGVHDLRTTRSGMSEIIAFDIEADPQLSLHDAHAITKDLEAEILKLFPEAEIMIHVDPHGEIEDSRHKVSGVHH
jgi:ferrous-iron efflux pump FieF